MASVQQTDHTAVPPSAQKQRGDKSKELIAEVSIENNYRAVQSIGIFKFVAEV
jgi:hypothetical protein